MSDLACKIDTFDDNWGEGREKCQGRRRNSTRLIPMQMFFFARGKKAIAKVIDLGFLEICATHLSASTSTPFNRRMMLTSDNSDPLEEEKVEIIEAAQFKIVLIPQKTTQ